MKDARFIPVSQLANDQLFGICNIKFDTKDITTPATPGINNVLTEDIMQVVLMAVFIYKLRFNMQTYGLSKFTNLVDNPFIVCGIFRDMVKETNNKPVLNYALKLLTTTQLNPWKDTSSPFTDNIYDFVISMSILTYLRVGTFRLAGFIDDKNKFNKKLLGDFYPLEQRSGSGSSISELIVCPRNFKICDDSKIMYKMEPARNPNPSFPLFPNNVNPSNSVAIGGVFDITTPAISNHVELIKSKIKEQILADKTAVKNAQLAAVQPATKFDISKDEVRRNFGQPSAPTIEPIELMPIVPKTSPPLPLPSGDGGPPPGDGDDDDDGDGGPPPSSDAAAANAAQKAINDAAAAAKQKAIDEAAAKQKVIDDAKALAAAKAKAASLVTKYIFAFDVDKTLAEDFKSDLSNLSNDYPDKYETIENMRRVINSGNYVWIITANNGYSDKDNFNNAYFGEFNSDIYKSPFFKFINPTIMKSVYTEARKIIPTDPKLGNITDWSQSNIHIGGLKPYAMYAQSLLYKDDNFFKRNKISNIKMYLFDDKSGDEIKVNSAIFDIDFILVTDFNSDPSKKIPILLKKFKEILNDAPSKIGSAQLLVIPDEYNNTTKLELLTTNSVLQKCLREKYINRIATTTYTPLRQDIIGDKKGGNLFSNLRVCVNGIVATNDAKADFLTDTNINTWTNKSDDIFSDHAPIKYKYQIDKTNNILCINQSTTKLVPDTKIISFITWNIAYQMIHTGSFYLSKFFCSETDPAIKCNEKDDIYIKRMQNILTAISSIMEYDFNKYTNYVFLQECTKTLLDVVAKVTGFSDSFEILHKDKNEFCLVVRMSAIPDKDDIVIFDFDQNKDGSPAMSKYISDQFYSYDIEVNTPDLKRVMCYIVKSTTTIFFNVHFSLGKSFIFQRQIQLYNFMNAIVYSIRSIPSTNADLYSYQNYDIVFTGDFNVNMLQRFPQDIKRFGYPDGNMIPIFFTCNYIKGQKTIISTIYNNASSARATNGKDHNYNLTNIDFSILYPRIGDAGTTPIAVEIQTPMPIKLKLPVAPPASPAPVSSPHVSTSTPATTLKVMSFNTWYKPFSAQKTKPDGSPKEPDMQYCNVNKNGKITNVCQENIMNEIMAQIEDGFQVIFLQEFTSRIQEVFDKCTFSDIKVPTTDIPFTMTYTPSGGGSPLEYYVYSVNAVGETITTLCSKKFFPNPANHYYMGNLTSFPNNPSYASDGNMTKFWEIVGGGRPYIVLVFDDIEMILINIHGPHPKKFGKQKKFDKGVKNNDDSKDPKVIELNNEYPNLQDYSFRQLGDMLRTRIPQKLKDYKIIFAGDFNMTPDTTQRHLVQLSERQPNGTYINGPFSSSSGNFDKQAQNSLPLKRGNTDATGTCCVEREGGSYVSGIYDQIYSNKLKITKYWTYNGKIEYANGGILFSDHLPVYAEIELPASEPLAPSGGGSKRFTLRNNNNNNKPTSRKISKSISTSASMPTTRFTKKQHSHNKKHKTRRHKH